jgi:AraC-like DNA-binding protein
VPLFWRDPRPPLSSFVSALWLAHQYVPGPHRQERVLPTGDCQLIIDLRASGTAGLSGPFTESIVLETADQFSVAGVAFRTGGARPFFEVPLREMANRHVPLNELWGGFAADFVDQVQEATAPQQRLAVIERLLTERIAYAHSRHPAVAYAIDTFHRDPAAVRIGTLIDRLGLSHRRFLDLFVAEVGLTPKVFCRIGRFQRVLRQVHQQRDVDWADVALSCGYFDQAHFIKEFTAFSGVNPSTYRSAASPHPNHVPLTG